MGESNLKEHAPVVYDADKLIKYFSDVFGHYVVGGDVKKLPVCGRDFLTVNIGGCLGDHLAAWVPGTCTEGVTMVTPGCHVTYSGWFWGVDLNYNIKYNTFTMARCDRVDSWCTGAIIGVVLGAPPPVTSPTQYSVGTGRGWCHVYVC